jgi:putative FmdB family regulatory protein
MPLYEYACKKCGHRYEEIRKFSDKHPTKCPECGGVLEQVISAPAVQFKGSGWYVTDYAKKGSGASSSSSSSASDSESSAKEAKETKDAKDSKDSKKDSKPKSESGNKKAKKD